LQKLNNWHGAGGVKKKKIRVMTCTPAEGRHGKVGDHGSLLDFGGHTPVPRFFLGGRLLSPPAG